MIFAAGLSPAWQQILQFDELNVGEVNRARTADWCASGKVINVGIAARFLGAEVSLLSLIGGLSGESIATEVESYGIMADWIRCEQPTRVCTTILERSGVTTELVENAGPVPDEQLNEFIDRFRTFSQVADVTVLTGSIPEDAGDDYYARLIRNVPAKFILDIRGSGLLHCLPYGPFLVKPNREELAETVDQPINDEVSLITAMQALNRMGAMWVVVSDGPKTLYATSSDEAWKFTPPEIEVLNPIGCGDCLAAGIAVSLGTDSSVVTAIQSGIAAATYNATQLFPAKVDVEASADIAGRVRSEQLEV